MALRYGYIYLFSFIARFITNSLKTYEVIISSEVTFHRVSAQINLQKNI